MKYKRFDIDKSTVAKLILCNTSITIDDVIISSFRTSMGNIYLDIVFEDRSMIRVSSDLEVCFINLLPDYSFSQASLRRYMFLCEQQDGDWGKAGYRLFIFGSYKIYVVEDLNFVFVMDSNGDLVDFTFQPRDSLISYNNNGILVFSNTFIIDKDTGVISKMGVLDD